LLALYDCEIFRNEIFRKDTDKKLISKFFFHFMSKTRKLRGRPSDSTFGRSGGRAVEKKKLSEKLSTASHDSKIMRIFAVGKKN